MPRVTQMLLFRCAPKASNEGPAWASGIAADELPMVKEKFYKGKSSHSKSGIGLSICEEIVSLMGGKLEVSSELNKRTDVVVILPKGERTDAQQL